MFSEIKTINDIKIGDILRNGFGVLNQIKDVLKNQYIEFENDTFIHKNELLNYEKFIGVNVGEYYHGNSTKNIIRVNNLSTCFDTIIVHNMLPHNIFELNIVETFLNDYSKIIETDYKKIIEVGGKFVITEPKYKIGDIFRDIRDNKIRCIKNIEIDENFNTWVYDINYDNIMEFEETLSNLEYYVQINNVDLLGKEFIDKETKLKFKVNEIFKLVCISDDRYCQIMSCYCGSEETLFNSFELVENKILKITDLANSTKKQYNSVSKQFIQNEYQNTLDTLYKLYKEHLIKMKQYCGNNIQINEKIFQFKGFRQEGTTTWIAKNFNPETDYYVGLNNYSKNEFIKMLGMFNKISNTNNILSITSKNHHELFRGNIFKPNTRFFIDCYSELKIEKYLITILYGCIDDNKKLHSDIEIICLV